MLTRPWVFATVLVVQAACAIVFLAKLVLLILGIPGAPVPWLVHELIEIGAAVGLILGLVFGGFLLRASLRRTRIAEEALRAASGEFMALIDSRFTQWGLTPAERDVALFALKGFSLAEIAAFRATSEGTVKAQTNAIYRKAGVSGRTQLLSLFVDDLIDVTPPRTSAERRA